MKYCITGHILKHTFFSIFVSKRLLNPSNESNNCITDIHTANSNLSKSTHQGYVYYTSSNSKKNIAKESVKGRKV